MLYWHTVNIYPLEVLRIRWYWFLCPNCTLPLSFLQPSSYEAVEPLDLEEFLLSQLRSGDLAVMQELGDFPEDDLKVEQVEKECRTVRHSVPEDG